MYTFSLKANDNFSVEIEALTLVMEQYDEELTDKERLILELNLDIGP